MVRTWILSLIGFGFASLSTMGTPATAADTVIIEPQAAALVVKIDGQEFTVFHHDSQQSKPYFWPVRAADGAILTRPIDLNEKEHPHHRGVWLSVDEVNDIKFWAERGRIVTKEITSASGNPATIRLDNDWQGRDGKPALLERTLISIYPNRLITYDVTLTTPPNQLARFDDTKEGFFGIRIAQSMREKEGGQVANSDGKKTTQECWGQRARWVDYAGPVNGKIYGVTLMDHSDNFRPSRYHVRDYGLFSMSPFGEGAYQNDPAGARPVILDDARPSIHFHYALYVHDGNAVEGQVDAAYNQFLKVTRTSLPADKSP